MSGALGARQATEEGSRGRVEAAKVRRYWPGKRPDWVGEDDEEDLGVQRGGPGQAEEAGPAPARTAIAAPVVVRKEDARLRRLQQQEQEGSVDPRSDGVVDRAVAAPQIVRQRRAPSSEDGGDAAVPLGRAAPGPGSAEEDGPACGDRRAAIRERLLREEAAAAAQAEALAEDEPEEESSEYETESSEGEEDALAPRLLLKPVFVPKADRETILERELLERQEEARVAAEHARLESRKEETKEILAHRLEVESAAEASAKEGPRGMADIDTDDEADEESAYEAWRLRELNRIGTVRVEREREVAEAAEKERWRNMSEEERMRHLAMNPKGAAEKPKKSWGFLQKYWHKGAFFQDEGDAQVEDAPVLGELPNRDFSAPTGQDKFDRSSLPKIMQVKNFGRRGQTKWTHLKDQDTTNWDTPWVQNDPLRHKYNQKMAASDQVFTKPKTTKT